MGNKDLKAPNKAPSKLGSVKRNNWVYDISWKNPAKHTSGDHAWEKIYVRVSLDLKLDSAAAVKKKRQVKSQKKKKVKLSKNKKSSVSNPNVTNKAKVGKKRVKVKVFELSKKATSFRLSGDKWSDFKRNKFYGGAVKVGHDKKSTLLWESSTKIDQIIFEVQGWNKKSSRAPNANSVTPGVPSAATAFNFTYPRIKGQNTISCTGGRDGNHTISNSINFDTSQSSTSELQYAVRDLTTYVYYKKDNGTYGYKAVTLKQSGTVLLKDNFEKTATYDPNAILQDTKMDGRKNNKPTSVLDLVPGEGISFVSQVIVYGIQGDATSNQASFNLAYPYPISIPEDGIRVSDPSMYIIHFNVVKASGLYNTESYVLEILRSYRPDGSDEWNESQWLDAAAREDSGWKEVYTIGYNERAFCHNKQKAKPEKYARTFYRIRSDNPNFDSVYSAPAMVGDYVSVPNPKEEKVKFLEAIPTDDGKSIKITYGWKVTKNSSNEANSDGTELSWSPDEYAWRSNQKPETLLMPDKDFKADDITVADLKDPEKRPTWAGDESMGDIPLMFDRPAQSDVRLSLLWNKQSTSSDLNGSFYLTGLDLYRQPLDDAIASFDWNNSKVEIEPVVISVSNKMPTDKLIYLVYRTSNESINFVWNSTSWVGIDSTFEIPDRYTFPDWAWDNTADVVLGSFRVSVDESVVTLEDGTLYGYPLTSSIVTDYDANLVEDIGVVYLRGLNEGTPYYLKLRRSLTEGMDETRYANTYAVFTGNTLSSSDEIVALAPSTKPTNLVLEGPEAIAEGDDFSLSWTFESTGEQTQWLMLYAKPYEDGDGEDHDVEVFSETDPEVEDTITSKVGDDEYKTENNIRLANPTPLYHVSGDNAGKEYGDKDAKGYARVSYSDIENLLIDDTIYLCVQIQTSGAFVQSNVVTIRVSKAPTIEVIDPPSEITKQPISLAFRSSVNTLDVKLMITAQGSHVWRPDGPEYHAYGQVVYSKYLRGSSDIIWTKDVEEEAEPTSEELEPSENTEETPTTPANDENVESNETEDGSEEEPEATEVPSYYVTEYTISDIVELHDMGRYEISVIGVDSETGLSTEYNLGENQDPLSFTVDVNWEHQAIEPSRRSYILKNANGLGVDLYIKSSPGMKDSDVCDVYRVTPDGVYLALEGQPFDTVVTDMYAPFSKTAFTRYRLCTRTTDGDTEWVDIGYRLKETCIRLDWGTGFDDVPSNFETGLSLPYNVGISDSLEKNFESRLHMNGTYSGYWTSGIKRTASLSTDIIKVSNPIEKEKLRALGRYSGPVYVRTPDGCAYTANVTLTTMPYNYNSQTMAIQLKAEEIAMADQFMINIITDTPSDSSEPTPEPTPEPAPEPDSGL